ncbi:MAG: nitrilase-related carbon-nitrogen hydrolase, partial [Hyphomicrobiaceae bacterium]
AKAGSEEGCDLIGGSCIIAPAGELVAQCETLDEELIIHTCDRDRCREIQDNVFNFSLHREPESYRLITENQGSVVRK